MEQRFALNGSTIERDGSEKPENDKQECRVIAEMLESGQLQTRAPERKRGGKTDGRVRVGMD
jgi:hypothetical protein